MRALIALLVLVAPVFASGELSGRRAPGFALPDSRFQYHDPQDYRGRILIVDIMATNCPHCATLSGVLEQVKARYAGKVAVLSLVNPPDNQATVARYAAAHKVSSPILFDCGQVAAAYLKVTPDNPTVEVPHIFVVDPQGTIVNDYAYNVLNRDIFEGKGLFGVIDRILAAPGSKKK